MICQNCKKQIDEDSNFCKYCGSKVVIANKCPHCGATPLPKDAKFCPDCGENVEKQDNVKVINISQTRLKIQKMIVKYNDGYKHFVQVGKVKQYNPSLKDKDCELLLSNKMGVMHYDTLYKKVAVILKLNAKEYGKLIRKGQYPQFSHKLTIEQLKAIINNQNFKVPS